MQSLLLSALIGAAPILIFSPDEPKASPTLLVTPPAADSVSNAPILPTRIEQVTAGESGSEHHEKATVSERPMMLDKAKPAARKKVQEEVQATEDEL